MKVKKLEELKDGMWCRLASGEVYEFSHISPRWRDFGYDQALIDMGAEWFPAIPEGYRLATEEDRKGKKPNEYRVLLDGSWVLNQSDPIWHDYEYIVPTEREPERSESKVYTVDCWPYRSHVIEIGNEPVDSDGNRLKPGDRVRVEKVEE